MEATRTIETVRAEMKNLRQLAYNAFQMRRADAYGKLEREIEALEREEDALLGRKRPSYRD